MSKDTSSETLPASLPDFRMAFEGLEPMIERANSLSEIVAWFSFEQFGVVDPDKSQHPVSTLKLKFTRFLIEELEKATQDVLAAWLKTYNDANEVEYSAELSSARPPARRVPVVGDVR